MSGPTNTIIEGKAVAVAAPRAEVADELRRGFASMRPQFVAALPSHIPPERFERVALTAVNNNPDLLSADRRSLFNACTKAAQDGLLPDGREGALVIFKDDKGNRLVQWMPMVYGIIKKMRNSGDVAKISAHIVYERELERDADGIRRFNYYIEDGEEHFRHDPIIVGNRGPLALAYATVKFKDGTVQTEFMNKEDIDKRRASSKAPSSPMWRNWYDEAAKKTVLRNVSKYTSMSADDLRVMDRDDELTEFQKDKEAAKKVASAIVAEQIASSAPKQIEAVRTLPNANDLSAPASVEEKAKAALVGADAGLDQVDQEHRDHGGTPHDDDPPAEVVDATTGEVFDPESYLDAQLLKLNAETKIEEVALIDHETRKTLADFGLKLEVWKKAIKLRVKALTPAK